MGRQPGVPSAASAPVLRPGEELYPHPDGDDTTRALDPYWWMDPLQAAGAVDLIADRMQAVCDGRWATRAIEVEWSLYVLDDRMRDLLLRCQRGQRRLVANEAGLGYLAERYDFIVTLADQEPLETFGPWSVTERPSGPNDLPVAASAGFPGRSRHSATMVR